MYHNYEEIASAVERRLGFDGNSATGFYDRGVYVVQSYGTVIAAFDGYDYTLNSTKYSRTTSRLQNIVRKAWAGKPVTELDAPNFRAWNKQLYPWD